MNPGRTPTCSCSRGAAFAQVTAVASESPATDLVGTGTTEPAAPAPGTTEATPATTTPDTVDASVPAVAPAASPLPKLVDLGAGKCIPCKKMAPILEEAKKLYEGRANVEFIDVWENPSMGPQYGIRMIPTQIFFDATGKEVFRHEGFFPMEDIQKQFESMGVSLKKE
ncbi:MAG: thioredoxin family protein [Candidatus Riflebacteria bacterium]|nr:thioredoxin family protein [Candidatus Riflebacteria bacterium]